MQKLLGLREPTPAKLDSLLYAVTDAALQQRLHQLSFFDEDLLKFQQIVELNPLFYKHSEFNCKDNKDQISSSLNLESVSTSMSGIL